MLSPHLFQDAGDLVMLVLVLILAMIPGPSLGRRKGNRFLMGYESVTFIW